MPISSTIKDGPPRVIWKEVVFGTCDKLVAVQSLESDASVFSKCPHMFDAYGLSALFNDQCVQEMSVPCLVAIGWCNVSCLYAHRPSLLWKTHRRPVFYEYHSRRIYICEISQEYITTAQRIEIFLDTKFRWIFPTTQFCSEFLLHCLPCDLNVVSHILR